MTHALMPCVECGKDRPRAGRGLCGGCYKRVYRAEHPEYRDAPYVGRSTRQGVESVRVAMSDALDAGFIPGSVNVPGLGPGTRRPFPAQHMRPRE